MKKLLLLNLVALCLYSCNANNTSNGSQTDTLCFQRISGMKSQDTATVQLLIQNNNVSGRFSTIPFEKDRRIGTLTGTLRDSIIYATWMYMQEGMTDSLKVEFKLSQNKLAQKTLGVDLKTGIQAITDTSTFSLVYNKIKCAN